MNELIALQTSAKRIGRLFRQCHDVEAGLELVTFIEKLVSHASVFTPAEQAELATLVKAMMVCQEHQDWAGLADYLFWEWPDFLHRIHLTRESGG
jgi:hypothetical protein